MARVKTASQSQLAGGLLPALIAQPRGGKGGFEAWGECGPTAAIPEVSVVDREDQPTVGTPHHCADATVAERRSIHPGRCAGVSLPSVASNECVRVPWVDG